MAIVTLTESEAKRILALPPQDRYRTMPVGLPPVNRTLGRSVVNWAHKYLRQPDGPHAGEKWRFTHSQMMFIYWWYAINEHGNFVYTHGVRRLPKGSGKSPFAAVMSIIELLAPVRFAGWDANGMPMAKPVGMPLVQLAATAESQATINTMRMVRALVNVKEQRKTGTAGFSRAKSRLVSEYGLDVGKTIIHTPDGGILQVITSSADAAEGALTTFAVMDQTEAWREANGGHDLFEVVDRNLGKTKSRGIETSNAWKPGQDSTAERTHDAWCLEQEGRSLSDAKTLMDIRMAPPDTDVEDMESLIRGVAFAYGDCHWADPEWIARNKVLDTKTPLSVAKRFYLNWPQVSEDAWVQPNEFARGADPLLIVEDGEMIALGFDGSRTRDATALIGCCISDGHVFELGVWEKPHDWPKDQKWNVPVKEVSAAVGRAFSKYNVVAFFADVREWDSYTKDTWPDLYASQLKVWAVPGGNQPQPIAWDMRNRIQEFTKACELVFEEITDEDGIKFTWDGSGVIRRHVANARARENNWGISIAKETMTSPKKIDAAVAMIIARHARRMYLSSELERPDTKARERTGAVYGF